MGSRRFLLEQLIAASSTTHQLDAPAISLSEDILTIEEVEHAEYYDIYVDGVLEESVPAVESTPTLISFSIGVNSYQAEQGMTWAEWVDSEYNTGGFEIVTNEYDQETVGIPGANIQYVGIAHNDYHDVYLNEVINSESYYLEHRGGSND